jgi:ligand-binding SRPBCC domain-containing protein
MATFEADVTLSCSCETAFDFLVQPDNILKILPPESGVNYIEVPQRFELGSLVKFELTGLGPVQRIVHEIVEFEQPNRFTERQVKGPLKSFEHWHVVEEGEHGEIRVIDRVEFEPPGGLAGFLVTESRILETLQRGFEYRHRELKRILEQTP